MDRKDLQETAALAHLNLTEEELDTAFPAFEQMLGFFAAMQAADNDREAFSAPAAGLSQEIYVAAAPVSQDFFRKDAALNAGAYNAALNEALLDNAGERDGRFVLIPNVL